MTLTNETTIADCANLLKNLRLSSLEININDSRWHVTLKRYNDEYCGSGRELFIALDDAIANLQERNGY